jgi:hypothetical protein
MLTAKAIRGKLLVSAIVAPVTGAITYFIHVMLAEWGILDSYATASGSWLKSHVSSNLVVDGVALLFGLILYGVALWVIWHKRIQEGPIATSSGKPRPRRSARRQNWRPKLLVAAAAICASVVGAYLVGYFFRGSSILDVIRYEAAPPTAGEPFNVNVYLANRGSLKAFGLQSAGGIGITNQELTESFVSQHFNSAYSMLRTNPEVIGNEIQAGSSSQWFTVNGPILDQSVAGAFESGRGKLYLILVLRYKDSAASAGQWRYTEMCVWFQNNRAVQLCEGGRNRTYTGT